MHRRLESEFPRTAWESRERTVRNDGTTQQTQCLPWLLGRSQIDKKTIATIAVEFAETCVHNAKNYPAVAECIAVVKRFLAGEATQGELSAARSAAEEAAEAAMAAASASEAEEAAAAWAAALAAEEATAEADNCEIIRKHVSADEICKLFRKDGAK